MLRKHLRVLAASLVLAGSGGCAPTAPPPAIHHLVLFKLRDPAEAGALLAESRAMVRAVPGAVATFAGKPAGLDRPGVLGDYDAALCVGFRDDAAYEAYLAHPAHEAIGRAWRERLEWMRIIDVRDAGDGP